MISEHPEFSARLIQLRPAFWNSNGSWPLVSSNRHFDRFAWTVVASLTEQSVGINSFVSRRLTRPTGGSVDLQWKPSPSDTNSSLAGTARLRVLRWPCHAAERQTSWPTSPVSRATLRNRGCRHYVHKQCPNQLTKSPSSQECGKYWFPQNKFQRSFAEIRGLLKHAVPNRYAGVHKKCAAESPQGHAVAGREPNGLRPGW